MPYAQEDVKPYGGRGRKGELVRAMFDHIAPTYDRLNHQLSWNIDRRWRRKALEPVGAVCHEQILDVATGTGDLAILAARMLAPKAIVAADISERMMEEGRKKVLDAGLENIITFAKEDCMGLSFADESFDVVTTAFGIRNFEDLERGLREIWRVLRVGGMFAAIEATTPVRFPMRQLFAVYAGSVLPLWGRVLSGDGGAYEYLTRSVKAFPQGEEMRRVLTGVGFTSTDVSRMTCGICTRYIAIK